jgi:hypothetical protein
MAVLALSPMAPECNNVRRSLCESDSPGRMIERALISCGNGREIEAPSWSERPLQRDHPGGTTLVEG